jgi:DNA polymerase-1
MKIQATTADAYQLIHDGVLALARAERQGICVDVEYCERQKVRLERRINRLSKEVEATKFYKQWKHRYAGKTNIYSGTQLSNLLYKGMKLTPPKETASGQGSTDDETLRQLGIPELDLILQIRKLEKTKNTYLEQFIRETTDGVMHPFFNLHIPKTFRSSSDSPNFQNIPKRDKEVMKMCRRAIKPRPGHMLIEADFSSLEVNIGTCYHKDPKMIQYLEDDKSDMHLDMAKQIFIFDQLDKKNPIHAILRSAAKGSFVFAQFYGDYYGNNAKGLCEWMKLPQSKWNGSEGLVLPDGSPIAQHFRDNGVRSFSKFTDHIKAVETDFWEKRFRVYNDWRKSWVAKYRKRGYLKMLTGFTCSGVMSKNEIMNYPVQGTAFHCLLKTLIELDRYMVSEKWDSRIIGQIHDSIIMDVLPSELDHVKGILNKIVNEYLPSVWGHWIIVPLSIEIDEYSIDGSWVE